MKSLEIAEFNVLALKRLLVDRIRLDHGLSLHKRALSVLPDGSRFLSREDGQIVYANYAKGHSVRKLDRYAVASGIDGSYWLCCRGGLTMPLN